MVRFLWHLDPDGWPLERIDTITGEHVPVFTGAPEEMVPPGDGGRPVACAIPKVSGVEWDFGGDVHPRGFGEVLGGMREGGS